MKAEKLNIVCVPTSTATATLAQSLGLKLTTLDEHPFLDLTVDGADEIDSSFRLIKGGGGALLLEKIVASSSQFVVTIADESKLVKKLGTFPLPVEVVPWGVKATAWKIERAYKTLKMDVKCVCAPKTAKPSAPMAATASLTAWWMN